MVYGYSSWGAVESNTHNSKNPSVIQTHITWSTLCRSPKLRGIRTSERENQILIIVWLSWSNCAVWIEFLSTDFFYLFAIQARLIRFSANNKHSKCGIIIDGKICLFAVSVWANSFTDRKKSENLFKPRISRPRRHPKHKNVGVEWKWNLAEKK